MTEPLTGPSQDGAPEAPLLIQRLRMGLAQLSPTERKVARALLADYPSAGLDSVQSLAQQAQVSAPSVVRFARRMGFSGFVELQQALRAELSWRSNGPLQLLDRRQTAGGHLEAMESSLQATCDAISQSLRQIPAFDMQQAIALLGQSGKRVTLGGGRFSQSLAIYLERHLRQLRPQVMLLPEVPHQRILPVVDAGRQDIYVLFDFRRYQRNMVELAQQVTERGAALILVTDSHLSPIAAHAQVVLPVQVESSWPFDTHAAAFVLVEMLAAGVLASLGDQALARMAQWERLDPLS